MLDLKKNEAEKAGIRNDRERQWRIKTVAKTKQQRALTAQKCGQKRSSSSVSAFFYLFLFLSTVYRYIFPFVFVLIVAIWPVHLRVFCYHFCLASLSIRTDIVSSCSCFFILKIMREQGSFFGLVFTFVSRNKRRMFFSLTCEQKKTNEPAGVVITTATCQNLQLPLPRFIANIIYRQIFFCTHIRCLSNR